MAQQTAKSLKNKALFDLEAGKLPQALKKAQQGIKKFPKDPDYHAIAGFVLTELEQYRKSIPHFAEAARMKPSDPQFAENLANALMQTGQILRALTYAEQKLEQFPNNKELVRVTDEIQLKGNNWRSIVEHASERLKKSPDDAVLLATRSRAYGRIGFEEQGFADIQRAYEIAPENNAVAFQMAIALHFRNDRDGCMKIVNEILARAPDHATSLLQLSAMVDKDQAAELIPQVEAAIAASNHVLSELEFAKAYLLSRRDGLDAAMPQFARANAAQHQINPYDPSEHENRLARVSSIFQPESPMFESGAAQEPCPIFVIGQPRSGTTLMEMMLSALPQVEGFGELSLASDLAYPYTDEGERFDDKAAQAIAEGYRAQIPTLASDVAAFVDKMPHNYRNVGFLLAAFPNAKIINMLRDPRDVGLSKWIVRFPAVGLRYASNLEAIAHSANLYRRYMTHWDRVFPGRVLTVSYEDLVSDPQTYSRQVADYCGLDWSEQMLHPEDNTKHVRTASVDQVRSKISTGSIGKWRSVAQHLTPLLDGLDPDLWPEYDFG